MRLQKFEIRPVEGNMTHQEIFLNGVKLDNVSSVNLELVADKQIPMVTLGVFIDPAVAIEDALIAAFPNSLSEAMERALLHHLIGKYGT